MNFQPEKFGDARQQKIFMNLIHHEKSISQMFKKPWFPVRLGTMPTFISKVTDVYTFSSLLLGTTKERGYSEI